MGWSSSPFHTAKQKGREAALAGLSRDTCPYWSLSFQLAWLEGYDRALIERQAANPIDRSESDASRRGEGGGDGD